jgi:hypothetical protein
MAHILRPLMAPTVLVALAVGGVAAESERHAVRRATPIEPYD